MCLTWSILSLWYFISNLISLVKRNHDNSTSFYWLAEQALPSMYNCFLVKKSTTQQQEQLRPCCPLPSFHCTLLLFWPKPIKCQQIQIWRGGNGRGIWTVHMLLWGLQLHVFGYHPREKAVKTLPFGIMRLYSVRRFYTSTITNNNLNCIITCYCFLKTSACFKVQERPYSPK